MKYRSANHKKGFTLIELLIVVAIIAILAAIAIPNFLAAQLRAKVARAKGELRSIATALESYNVDFNQYPYYNNPIGHFMFIRTTPGPGDPSPDSEITTPIAYMTSIPPEPFPFSVGGSFYYPYRYSPFLTNTTDNYNVVNAKYHGAWILGSDGPAKTFNPIFTDIATPNDIDRTKDLYDPTNGTVSSGNIIRSQSGN